MNALQLVGPLMGAAGMLVALALARFGTDDLVKPSATFGLVAAALGLFLYIAGRVAAGPAEKPIRRTPTIKGPGRFRVSGVTRTTQADAEILVEAASESNARVKAELKGMVVTAIERDFGI
ncbi:hypothetical protein [Humisphaera borealis]|uniref:Uncharacterized protein n=1 Tax=Humisphaera borealis TaxID=2807512 RepID=A0A7M2WWP2_9BACT|nr:hypothetical protein [Humisphaera borealis]QOV89744.1 hypothetical protein IPV69_26775 [Humisphaera borealis]